MPLSVHRRTALALCLFAIVGVGLIWPPHQIAQATPEIITEPQVVTEPKQRLIRTAPGDTPFDVTRHTIALKEIRGGGPPKDGIPALLEPSFISPSEATSLRPQDMVLGVSIGGVSKAYPIRILNWHELVNDRIGSRPILVSW